MITPTIISLNFAKKLPPFMLRSYTVWCEHTSPEKLKQIWVDKMVELNSDDRWKLILSLEKQLNLDHLSLKSYLALTGVAGYSKNDLQPYDIGHVVRYLKISVPSAVPAIFRTMWVWGFISTSLNA